MPTRLSLWCDRLMEAGWLATLLLIPIFFQTTTARIFEPDKVMVLRSIALLIALAWAIRTIEVGRRTAREDGGGLPRAMVWPTILLVLGFVVSTAASIAPRMSLLGSYQRAQGLYSLVALVIVFGAMVGHLRRRDQLDRLVTTLVLGSLPVALFAVMQGLGNPPGIWGGLFGGRVFSTLGNPIFLAGYLLMVMPLVVARLVRPSGAVLRAVYGVILALHGVAFVMTLSRGPWLGLAVGVLFFGLGLSATRARRNLAVGIATAVLLGVVGVGVLSLPGVRAQITTAPAPVQRLSELFDMRAGSTGAVRILLWEAAARVMSLDPARLPIGYGPETGLITLTANTASEIRTMERADVSPDRAHNEIWDRLIETGILGLAAYLWLFAAAFYLLLNRLGLATTSAQKGTYVLLMVVGSLGGGMLPVFMGAGAFSGIGFALGLLAGLGIYLLVETLTRRGAVELSRESEWLLLALLAALVGHFVEVNLGPANAVTRTLFWAFLGVVGALAARPRLLAPATVDTTAVQAARAVPGMPVLAMAGAGASGGVVTTSVRTARKVTARTHGDAAARVLATPASAYGMIAALLTMTLAYSFIPLDGFDVSRNGYAIVVFLGVTLVLGGGLLLLENQGESGRAAQPRSAPWLIPALGIGGLAVFVVLRSVVLLVGGDAISALYVYFALLLAGLAALAATLPVAAVGRPAVHAGRAALYAPLALGVLALLVFMNVTPLQADIYQGTAEVYVQAGDLNSAIQLTSSALKAQLGEPVYAQKLAEQLTNIALASPTIEMRDEGFQQAVLAAELAATGMPANANFRFNVGHIYLLWGQSTQDATQRNQRFTLAAQNYQKAVAVNPNLADAYVEWGQTMLLTNQSPDSVQSTLLHALQLDPNNAPAYFQLGRLYGAQNQPEAAERAYLQGLAIAPKSPLAVTAYSALGDLYQKSNRLEEAIAMTQKAVELSPENWVTHLNLTMLYARAGRKAEAQAEAQTTYSLAPADAKQRVVEVITQLQQPSRP